MSDHQPCLINLEPSASVGGASAAATATLVIDYRESALISSLTVPYKTDTLHVGDIWIGCSDSAKPSLVLERKTVRDWESSVMDGRYREQRGRLLAFSQDTGARIGYILEGRWDSCYKMDSPAIMKLVARMQFVHGVPVMWTGSVKETAQLVQALQSAWEKDGAAAFTAEMGAQRAVDGIKIVKKDSFDDPRLFAIRCISQCHGVSPKSAEAILDAFGGTLAGVMRASEDEVAAVKCGTRRIGPVVSGKLVRLLAGCGACSTEGTEAAH